MDVYFSLWNPKVDSDSFADFDKVQSKARAGRAYHANWICPSTKPRAGDVAIMQRTGRYNNGVFAKGFVTNSPYLDKYGVRRVRLKLDSFLPIGQEISREEIVTKANYIKKWMPMASGNVVLEPLVQTILLLWNKRGQPDLPLAEEVKQHRGLPEGATAQITINAYERNTKARKLCIDHYGLDCCICGFNFKAVYGDAASDLIHIHHLKPLSQIRQEYEVDLIKDLRPVCPNCHAVIHTKEPAYTINETKVLLKKSST